MTTQREEITTERAGFAASAANTDGMETEVDDIPRRTWAPFVGAALAALTAGSLVVFSLVAQRTSLDGFPDRGVSAADRTGAAAPSSITIAPIRRDRHTGPDNPAIATTVGSSPSPTSLLEIAESVSDATPTATTTGGDTTAAESARTQDVPVIVAQAPQPGGRLPADEAALLTKLGGGAPDGNDGTRAAGWDPRHDGKHSHKSHEIKNKAKAKHSMRSQRSKRAAGASRKHNAASARPSNGSGSTRSASAKTARDSRSASSQRPTGKSYSSPPSHSNAGGNSKARGRGHKKH